MSRSTPPSPNIAALLSFLIPGVGHIYTGNWVWGIFWLIVTPGFWIGSGGLLGWLCHVLAGIQAASFARDKR